MFNLKQTLLLAATATLSIAFPNPYEIEDPSCWISIDLANKCGQWYGGSYDRCKEPRKTFARPACPGGEPAGQTICQFQFNESGEWFGECYDPDSDTLPQYSPPECVKDPNSVF